MHRFPCVFHGRDVVITHGYKKESQKMPRAEFERAAGIRAAYLATGHAHPLDPEDRSRPTRR
jgi:DNA repair protein RadC